MLKVNNIEVVYNDVILVLKGISLEVPDGSVVALLGANGAGKTTTLKAISGILDSENGELEDGQIEFMGKPIHRLDPDKIVKIGITMVPEGRRVFEDLNVIENIMIGAHTRPDRRQVKRDIEMIFGYFPVLAGRKNQLAIFLSGGEQQMLVIGRAHDKGGYPGDILIDGIKAVPYDYLVQIFLFQPGPSQDFFHGRDNQFCWFNFL